MMRVRLSILAAAACALAAIPLAAANGPAAKADRKATAAVRRAWKPETLSGKISMVNADRRLVVVETPDGVPFDMVVTGKTRIQSGDQAVSLKELTQDRNKSVSVTFTPERRGDVAKTIEIGGAV